MSAQVQAVSALCLLATLGGGVLMWAWWPTPRRVQEAEDEARAKRTKAIAAAAVTLREERAALADTSVPANYASGEYPLVPPPKHAAVEVSADEPEYVAEPVVEPAEPEPAPSVPWWAQQPTVYDEATPLFAAGTFPALERLESHTDIWARDGLLERIRRDEYEQAWRNDDAQAGVDAA